MKATTNYNIPTYEETDNPDLIDGYNVAVTTIDTQLKENADAITYEQSRAEAEAMRLQGYVVDNQTDIETLKATVGDLTYIKLTVGELAKGINIAYKATE